MSATKVALVTGASAGLGAAVVKALCPHYRVVVNYFSRPEKAAEVIKECEAISPVSYKISSSASEPRFHSIQGDVANRSDIERMVKETVDKMGRLDVVISNSGWTKTTTLMDIEQQVDEEMWDKCFNINVKSHLWLLYAAKPYLEKGENPGNFVTVASMAGIRPGGSSLAYAVTKAAQIHLTKTLAVICGKTIKCNCVSPGLMMTEWGIGLGEKKQKVMIEKAALKATTRPEDVAEMILSLCQNQSITGQNVVVDGGITI